MDIDYKALLDNLYDGVYFVDKDRRILYWNKGAERISGYTANQVLQRFCHDNILNHVSETGVNLCNDGCPLNKAMRDGQAQEAEIYLQHADGHRVPVIVRVAPTFDDDGKINGAIEIFQSNERVSSLRRYLRRMADTAHTDPLLGIGNRIYIEEKINFLLAGSQAIQTSLGIMFIDLDEFKAINDQYGHATGDMVLKTVIKTLNENLRSTDLLGRWGGDEFIVLLMDTTPEGLSETTEKIRALINTSTVHQNGHTIPISASIGATIARSQDSLETFIQRADRLMYVGKRQGGNQVTCDTGEEG